MARKLPWAKETVEKKSDQGLRSSTPVSKRKHDSSDDDLVDSDLNAIRSPSPKKKTKKRADRTPSTSPPPAPPDVEYMREGYNADDIYRMVEDEFWATAQSFTKHIHRAEYVRLKKLAKSRGNGTLQSIARATDGRTKQSEEMKLRLEAEDQAKKRKKGLRDLDGEDESSEGEDEYMHDPQLAGLMSAGTGSGKDLLGLTMVKSKSRAAAGLSQSPRNMERMKDVLGTRNTAESDGHESRNGTSHGRDLYSSTEDEDDLDARPSKPSRATYDKAQRQRADAGLSSKKSSTIHSETSSKAGSIFKQFAKPLPRKPDNQKLTNVRMDLERSPIKHKSSGTTSNDNRLGNSTADTVEPHSSTQDWLAKRRAAKERKERETKRKAKAADDIPTFLI